MKPTIRVGDKVIGLTSWYSEPYVGTVMLTNLEGFDPLHDILVNVSNDDLKVSSITDYESRLLELSGRTKLLSSQETKLYTSKVEKKLLRLYSFLNSNQGKKAANYELEMQGFFQKRKSVFLLKLRVHSKLCCSFVGRHAANVFIGTIELLLGDIYRFYESRLEIRKLNQQIRSETSQMKRSMYMSRMMGSSEDDTKKKYSESIARMKAELKDLKSEKTEISRAFIAVMISVASLIVSIIALQKK
jgi:hypothetical protein